MNYPSKKFKAFDMNLARELYNFFFNDDSLVFACRDALYNLVFKGEIEIQLGKKFTEINMTTEEKRELFNTFKTVLDYRFILGVCPFKIVETYSGNFIPRVPQFGAGVFYHNYDTDTLVPEVVYVLRKAFPYSDMMSETDIRAAAIQDGFHVFVWPGLEPNYTENKFNSVIYKAYSHYLKMNELWNNFLVSDFNQAHPPIFTTSELQKKKIDDISEDMIIDPFSKSYVPGPEEAERMKRNFFRERDIGDMSSDIRKLTIGIPTYRTYTMEDGLMNIQRQRFFQDNMWVCPEGERFLSAPVPTSTRNFAEMLKDFEEKVCAVMGIPRDAIFSTGASKYINTNVLSLHTYKTAVTGRRNDVNLFYGHAYRCSYLPVDPETIQNLMNESEDYEEAKRVLLCQLKENPYEVEVVFKENPFLDLMKEEKLLALMSSKILTKEETIFMIRKNLGMPTDDKIIKQQADEMRKEEEMMMKQQTASVGETAPKGPNGKGKKKPIKKTKKSDLDDEQGARKMAKSEKEEGE